MNEDSLEEKEAVANILKSDINSKMGRNKLKRMLQKLLSSTRLFDERTAELFYSLISGALPSDEYLVKLKRFDNSPVCGLVWNANFFAYRCRDCGISPCMSLCADCFLGGNHEGHDFNMFKSQAGGACDCGDATVMRKEGFCSRHKTDGARKNAQVPEDLVDIPKLALPILVIALYERLEEHLSSDNNADVMENILSTSEVLLNVLNKLSKIEVLREIICEKIMSPIDNLRTTSPVGGQSEVSSVVSPRPCDSWNLVCSTSGHGSTSVEVTVRNTINLNEGPQKMFVDDHEQVAHSSIMKEGRKQTYIQFLMDILVKAEFPSKLATFLLQLLPNTAYKETFTRLFCRQYTAIGKSLSTSLNPDMLSNHMVHVSVQLFSNEYLALKMVKEENLLFKMIFILSKMIGECLENYSLEIEGHETSIMTVNCDHHILSGHRNWPIASDMTNILSHQSVAKMFLETGDCLSRWMHFVNMLTGMNINNRRFITHIEYEPRTYYTAFSIEFESAATVMWEIYRAIIKLDNKKYALKMIDVSAAALKDWYSFVPDKLNKSSFTFHLLLHRYFALFVSQAVNHFNEDIRQVLPVKVILNALGHLTNCAVALQEIRAGLWFYNGHQIRGQAQSYVQSYFCNSMLDLDIFFLQIALSVMDSDVFLDMLLDRFCIKSWFQFGEAKNICNQSSDNEKKLLLVEGCLNLILILLSHRVYSGATEEEMLRKDVITNLCVADRTHSQLIEIIPTRPGDTHSPEKYFDKILAEVADFKMPAVEASSMQQGMYTPKDSIWINKYDYNHIQLRVFKKSDEQAAHERYNAIMQKNKFSSTTLTWPPLHNLEKINPVFDGVYSLLQSQTLHKMLIFIIYQFVERKQPLSESIIVTAVHLLQLSVWHENTKTNNAVAKMNHSADDVLIDLVNNYLDTFHNSDQKLRFVELIKEELKKDSDMQLFVDEFKDDDDITFLIERKFHKTFFKPLCSYVDATMSGTFSLAHMVKHIKTLLSQLLDKKLQLLKRLIQYWKCYCTRNNIIKEELPVIKSHPELKHFPLLISILIMHFEYFFEVLSPLPDLPASIFDINFPHSSITANAHVVINNEKTPKKADTEQFLEEMIDESSMDQFIDITQCDRLSAIEWLKKGNQDIETSIALYFNQASSDHLADVNVPDIESNECKLCHSEMAPVSVDSDISLLTLLIKLRKIFTQSSLPVKSKPMDSNICGGNGAYYVNKLLKNLYRASNKNAEILHRLCPDYKKTTMTDELTLSPEQKSKQARREKANEKRKELLMEFAQKQKKFLDNIDPSSTMMTDGHDEGCHSSDETQCFECVICGQKTPSTEDNPIGLIVFLQPSTVFSNQHVIPPSCKLSSETDKTVMYREVLSQRQQALLSCFDSRSARSSFECGLDSGINIQSCRHYVHIDCQQSYFKTLQEDNQRLINSDKGEFLCPLCRKLSNGVLSLLPPNLQQNNPKDLKKENTPFPQRCEEVSKFLTYFQQGGLTHFTARALEFTVLTASMATIAQTMEELTKSSNRATRKFYKGESWKWSDKFFILLASLRHNLDSELLNMKSNRSIPSLASQACLRAVLAAFHFHSQYVTSPMRVRWCQLCYGRDDMEETSYRRRSEFTYNAVPLLLVDPVSLLLQLVMTWPRRMTPDELRCTIQLIYNLVIAQGLCRIGSQLQSQEKISWQHNVKKDEPCEPLYALAGTVWKFTTIFENENTESDLPGISQSVVSLHTIEMQLQQLCLPFLRSALTLSWVFLQNHQFDLNLFDSPVQHQFQTLASMLQLGEQSDVTSSEMSCTSYLRWATSNPLEMIKCWCEQVVIHPSLRDRKSLTDLLPIMLCGHPQKLIKLPKLFDSLFQEYRKRTCDRCKQRPDDPTVCLVCGAFLCFHNNCCRNKDDINECVAHSIKCGCGTGVFLVISSSFTLVIRDERVCLWGSVYLDKHGEEDRDLKRGKPLYLNEERYQRLEKEWRTHSLDTSTKLWGLHLNRL